MMETNPTWVILTQFPAFIAGFVASWIWCRVKERRRNG